MSMAVILFLYIPCVLELVRGLWGLLIVTDGCYCHVFVWLFLRMCFACKLCFKHSYHMFLNKPEKLLLTIMLNQE